MKKIIILLIPLLCLLFVAKIAFASDTTRTPVTVTLPPNQTINHDYFAAGDTVTILGTINGDVYTAGGTVTVLGKVNGDVLAAGGNVTISGNVSQDVRVAGGTVHVAGTIGQNLTVVGGTIDVSSDAKIGRSVTFAGGQVLMFAPVTRDVNFAGGDISFNNRIEGNVTGYAGTLNLLPNTAIAGDLTYTSTEPVSLQSGAKVTGTTNHILPKPHERKAQESGKNVALGIIAILTWIKVVSLISTLIIGLILIKLFPNYLENFDHMLTTRGWACFGLGVVTAIVAPVAFILLLITVIGLPLAFLMLGIYLVSLFLAKMLTVIILGKKIVNWVSPKKGYVWGLIIGAFLYELITFITPINLFITLVTYAIGLGAVILLTQNYYRDLRTKKLI